MEASVQPESSGAGEDAIDVWTGVVEGALMLQLFFSRRVLFSQLAG